MLPSNEVADDIRAEVDLWIMDSPGRNRTGHHAIPRGRVVHGHDRWDALGLAAVQDPSIYVETTVATKRKTSPSAAKKSRSSGVGETEVVANRPEMTAKG